jgi:transposase
VRATTLRLHLLGLKALRVVGFEFGETGLVVDVGLRTRRPYCPGCLRRLRSVYATRERTWRHLEFAGLAVYLRYGLRRVNCRRCGVVSELVPWAEHASDYTRGVEEAVAWMARRMDQSSVCSLMGIAWRTVGRIAARVMARLGPADLLDRLTHIGIDELSYRRHHKYPTVVTDHLHRRVVCVGEGSETLRRFFDEPGAQRAAELRVVKLEMCEAYIAGDRKRAPQAELVFDRFHVQRLAQEALDEVRRAQVRERNGTPEAKAIQKTRFVLQKRRSRLELEEHEKPSAVQRTHKPLYRGYLLKESLAVIFNEPVVTSHWSKWRGRSCGSRGPGQRGLAWRRFPGGPRPCGGTCLHTPPPRHPRPSTRRLVTSRCLSTPSLNSRLPAGLSRGSRLWRSRPPSLDRGHWSGGVCGPDRYPRICQESPYFLFDRRLFLCMLP